MLVEFALLHDLYEDGKPFGIWITDKEALLGMFFIPEYEDAGLGYYRNPGSMDVDTLGDDEWAEFWKYWTESGGHRYFIIGPYKLDMEGDDIDTFGSKVIRDLEGYIKEWTKRGVFK